MIYRVTGVQVKRGSVKSVRDTGYDAGPRDRSGVGNAREYSSISQVLERSEVLAPRIYRRSDLNRRNGRHRCPHYGARQHRPGINQ